MTLAGVAVVVRTGLLAGLLVNDEGSSDGDPSRSDGDMSWFLFTTGDPWWVMTLPTPCRIAGVRELITAIPARMNTTNATSPAVPRWSRALSHHPRRDGGGRGSVFGCVSSSMHLPFPAGP